MKQAPHRGHAIRGNPWQQWCRRGAALVLIAALLAAGPAGAAPLPAAVSAASGDCLEALLRRLGWRFDSADVAAPIIEAGRPCTRASLADALAQGDLRVTLPRGIGAAERVELDRRLFAEQASVCAYAFVLGDAVKRATTRLEDNHGYRFTGLQLGWIGFGLRGARAQGWQEFRSLGRGYRPAGSNSRAIDAFYSGHVRSECGVGRQIAQLATQRELYGDAAFDQEFSPGELSIGTFLTLHDTDSILLGAHAGDYFADGDAVKTSQLGRQAFAGAPGFIVHVLPRRYLDDINNQAENFVVVDVDAAAADALARHRGFDHYDALNHRIWQLSRQLHRHGRDYFQRLLLQHDAHLRAALSPPQRAIVAELDGLLADPFYTGFDVYVHAMGVKPIGYHVVRLLDRNPRTPFAVELTLHNLHTTLYWRWIARQLEQCRNGATQR